MMLPPRSYNRKEFLRSTTWGVFLAVALSAGFVITRAHPATAQVASTQTVKPPVKKAPATNPQTLKSPTAKSSSAKAINADPVKFPVRISRGGALVVHLQVLLDRSNFSPGIVDGAWGGNAARALTFFAGSEKQAADPAITPAAPKTIDRATYNRLRAAAGPAPILERYTITSSDVRGPYLDIPELVYDQAKLRCLCYSSLSESLSERFHTTPIFLGKLNPGVEINKLKAGTSIIVPNVDNGHLASAADTVPIVRLIISKSGFWTHALDAEGRVLFHFPSTLGAGYDPSPTGDFKIAEVSHDPAFHYQPKLFAEVPDSKPEAHLPPGPNSPVGVVWIGLSKPHYGIHGTSSPNTIGYATSHGCVRLTNWDASQLSDLVMRGTPVQFK